MRLWNPGHPIRVIADVHGRPLSFLWDGANHRVSSIEDVREPQMDWWSVTGEVHRVYYTVVTDQGMIWAIIP